MSIFKLLVKHGANPDYALLVICNSYTVQPEISEKMLTILHLKLGDEGFNGALEEFKGKTIYQHPNKEAILNDEDLISGVKEKSLNLLGLGNDLTRDIYRNDLNSLNELFRCSTEWEGENISFLDVSEEGNDSFVEKKFNDVLKKDSPCEYMIASMMTSFPPSSFVHYLKNTKIPEGQENIARLINAVLGGYPKTSNFPPSFEINKRVASFYNLPEAEVTTSHEAIGLTASMGTPEGVVSSNGNTIPRTSHEAIGLTASMGTTPERVVSSNGNTRPRSEIETVTEPPEPVSRAKRKKTYV